MGSNQDELKVKKKLECKFETKQKGFDSQWDILNLKENWKFKEKKFDKKYTLNFWCIKL